jgi:hypothetical protein
MSNESGFEDLLLGLLVAFDSQIESIPSTHLKLKSLLDPH